MPQKQTVHSSVVGADIGTFKHLPPTLLLQYHFTGLNGYKPYVGAGVNYTDISKVNLLGGGATLDSHSWGGALQIGADFPINKQFFFNVDLKKIWIDTKATGSSGAINGVSLGTGITVLDFVGAEWNISRGTGEDVDTVTIELA